jgi:hypothetical protein
MDNETEEIKHTIPQQKSSLNLTLVITGGGMLFLLVVFFFQNQQLKKEIEILKSPPKNQTTVSPSPKISASKSNDPTINWKAYTKSGYPYQISYPNDWRINEVGGEKDSNLLHYALLTGTVLSDDKKNYITIDILIRVQKKVSPCFESSIKCYLPSEMKKIQIQNLDGYQVESYLPAPGGFDISQKLVIVIFEKNYLTYNISMQYNVDQNKAYLKTFDQILSTFRFTN